MKSEADLGILNKQHFIAACCAGSCLVLAQNDEIIEQFYLSLKEDFLCADEREAGGCLGAEIRKNEDGSLALKQLQLIKRIIAIVRVKDASLKATPAVKPLLSKILDEKDRKDDSFHHRPPATASYY